MVYALDGDAQGFIVSSSFSRYLFFRESEVVVGGDVVDYPLKTLYGVVLGHMGLV